jgi:hypothetical protein
MKSHDLQWMIPIVLLFVSSIAGADPPLSSFESPPILPVQTLAPASLIAGDGFYTDQSVRTDGLTAHFIIRSDVGTFDADGLEMLKIRVDEIPAIVELTNTSKSSVFAQALATNAARPVTAAGQMLLHPVDTVKGLPAGVGRFFDRVGLGAQRIKEAATEPEESSASDKAAQVATRTGQTTRDVFGYEQERRELAKKLNVDPYTTNPILAKQLDDFALVAFRAHVGVTTSMAIFIPGSMAITATRIVSQWVWDTPRADLIVKNQTSLEAMGISEDDANRFMKNQAFPLSVATTFVLNLNRLSSVSGFKSALDLADTAQSEQQARFLTDALGMLANYHEKQLPLSRIFCSGTIIGQDRNGQIVVEAPVDYLAWTPRAKSFATRQAFRAPRRSVWVTGQLSPLARKNFRSLGWATNEHVPIL